MKKFEKKSRDEKRRILLSKKYELSHSYRNEKLPQDNASKKTNKGHFARPNDSALFLKGTDGTAARTPLNKRLIAIILAIVMIAGLIPAGVFMLRPKAEGMSDLGPVEMTVLVNGEKRDSVQIQPGLIKDHIASITEGIENAPAKMVFEGAFLIDKDKNPVTETRIASVGGYKGDVYYALGEDNDTGIKKTDKQSLILVYSSEYVVTTNPGEGGSIEVDDTVPYGTDLHVSVTAPKGSSIASVTYTIGDTNYTANVNSNGDFTIPGNQVVNDITIASTYSQIEAFTIKDARKVRNSKYYNLYGLEGHGGITATIGVSAEGQPYDDPVIGSNKLYSDWNENKFLFFTSDAVKYNERWGGTYSNNQVYGAPSASVYAGFNNITTNSSGVITDIQPNSVTNGASATFYLYSQSKSGNSNGWGLNYLSINGEEINYPVGSTVGSSQPTEMKDETNVTVTLVSTDSPLYWNQGDVTYKTPNVANPHYAYFSKQNKASYSGGDVAHLWSYDAPTINKHRYIYRVDIDHVKDNLEVAYNFKDVDKRKIILTGLKGIEETGAAYEWRGHNVQSTGNTSGIRNFESRDYYYASASNPATTNSDDLNGWKQNEYDAFFFESYKDGLINGVNWVPSANIYTYRVKSGFNPYSVEARARYISDGEQAVWLEKEDFLARPIDGNVNDSFGDLDTVVIRASEDSNAKAHEFLDGLSLPSSWTEEGSILVDWIREYFSFNSNYRFWGESDGELKHKDVSQREIRKAAGVTYTTNTHNIPEKSQTGDYLFLSKIAGYETTLKDEGFNNYKFYGLALQQNEAKDQLLQLNAHPYQYTMVFDANGGTFPNALQTGYAKLADGEFADAEFYTSKTGESVKQSDYLTMEDGDVTTYMPKRSMTPERKGFFFAGWKLYNNNQAVTAENYNTIYVSNQAFTIDADSVEYAEGNVKKDENHTFTFKAEWVEVAPEADMATLSVQVKKQTSSDESRQPIYSDIYSGTERQIAGDTVLLDQHKPAPEKYYVLDEAESKVETKTNKGSTAENTENQLVAAFKWRTSNLEVKKRVTGNPKSLKNGFEITILLTKDADSPVEADDAIAMIAASNPDNITLSGIEKQGNNAVKIVGTFGRSNSVILSNVPYGWTATISEPKAVVEDNEAPDYTTTITSSPDNAGMMVDVDNTSKTTWSGTITEDTVVTVTNDSDSYLVLDKNISRNEDGKYDLTLEAYATGDVTSETITEKTPTDFVLVLDQSGSMSFNDMATGYTEAGTKAWKISDVSDSESETGLYYKETDKYGEDHYYRVYKTRGNLYEYMAPNSVFVNDTVTAGGLSWFQGQQDETKDLLGQYYFRPSDGLTDQPGSSTDNNFYPVHVYAQGKALYYALTYKYTAKSGRTYVLKAPDEPYYKNIFGGDKVGPGQRFYTSSIDLLGVSYNTVNTFVHGWTGNSRDSYVYGEINLLSAKTGMYIQQTLYKRHSSYSKLCYTDEDGVQHTLIDATFCDANGNALGGNTLLDQKTPGLNTNTQQATWNGTLYKSSGEETRLQALNTALKQFVAGVAEQTDDYGKVDNRVAIVGFSSENDTNYTYNNTELLTGVDVDRSQDMPTGGYALSLDGKRHDGPQYDPSRGEDGGLSNALYKNTLLNATAEENVSNVVRDADGFVVSGEGKLFQAIDDVTAYGGTQPAYGMNMAKQIFANRGDSSEYISKSTNEPAKRNTVVIFFTDGRPGNNDTVDQYEEANKVVNAAYALKTQKDTDNTPLNTTIYSIGVFGESDGNPLTKPAVYYEGDENTNQNTAKANANVMTEADYNPALVKTSIELSENSYMQYGTAHYIYNKVYYYRDCIAGTHGYPENADDTIAYYMRTVSSEYPKAEYFSVIPNSDADELYTDMTARVRKTPVDEKYYFMATDHDSLLEVFEKVAETESTEVAATTTGMSGTTALLRDVINGNDFVIPDDPTKELTVKVYTQKGKQRTAPQDGEPANAHIDFEDDEGNVNEWVELTDAIVNWYHDDNGNYKDDDGNAYVDISGFNYGTNYIAKGKLRNSEEGTAPDEGKKLIVTISGLEPKRNSTGTLHSNTDDSGIYKIVAGENEGETKAQQMDAFVSPTMERYAYKVTEPHEYTKDTFNVNLTRGGINADETAPTSILVTYDKDDGKREEHLVKAEEGNTFNWTGVQNGDTAYWELLNNSNKDETNNTLTATVLKDGLNEVERTYQLDLLDSEGTNTKDPWTNIGLKHENSTLQVTNVSNYRDVTITEETRGVEEQADYSDKEHQFPIQMTLKNGETPFTGKIKDATITRKKDGTTEKIDLDFGHDGKLNTNVKLANGDKIEFEVLNGYTLTVLETAEDAGQYDVTYDPDDDTEVEGTVQTIGDTNFIKVINTLHENPDISSGILDDNNPFGIILAVLAGICGLTAAGTVVHRKRKPEET